jgi:hypothetical protein
MNELSIIPLLTLGNSIDFCMRASIPLLCVFILLLINSLDKMWSTKKYVYLGGALLILAIGCVTPMGEIGRTVHNSFSDTKFWEEASENVDKDYVLNDVNTSGPVEGNLFFRIFAR